MFSSLVVASLAVIPQPREVQMNAGTVPTNTPILVETDASIAAEGYRLEIKAGGISIRSADAAGAFYARQTLEQMRDGTNYPCAVVSDAPQYRWRGMHFDDCRHFFGKETLKRTLDLMAQYKMNVLHWHLTEDQGWRIDVPGLPELVKYGSVRAESPRHGAVLKKVGDHHESERNGCPYGPYYYKRADIEEIVAYATARHVEIVPEIELPGHSMGALAAYPELACFPENITPRLAMSDWGVSTNVCCVGNDKTLRFFEKVLDYVCEIFPSKVVHVGGDECPRAVWSRCPKCQARMKAEGLAKVGDLQAWITRKMAGYLAKKGRRIMGWDEMLAGDVPASAIGQSWRTQAEWRWYGAGKCCSRSGPRL